MELLAFLIPKLGIVRIAEDEPEKSAIKNYGLFFQEKEKRLSESKYSALAESHVPCFQERVGTKHPGYMIPDRLPWRHRARPSATLHEIQVRSEERTCSEDCYKSGGGRQAPIMFRHSFATGMRLDGTSLVMENVRRFPGLFKRFSTIGLWAHWPCH